MAAVAKRLGTKLTNLGLRLAQGAQDKAVMFLPYARAELMPPSPAEFPAVQKGFENLIKGYRTKKWRELTVHETMLNAVVTIEVLTWFFIGQCVGRGSLVGYNVPGTSHHGLEFTVRVPKDYVTPPEYRNQV